MKARTIDFPHSYIQTQTAHKNSLQSRTEQNKNPARIESGNPGREKTNKKPGNKSRFNVLVYVFFVQPLQAVHIPVSVPLSSVNALFPAVRRPDNY